MVGKAILYGSSEVRLVRLARAYSVLGDIEYLVRSGEPMGDQERAVLLDWIGVIEEGRMEAGRIGDIRGVLDD